jgi:hypothetical protein
MGFAFIVKAKTDLHMTFNGRPDASDGDMTACGATLIASQSRAHVADRKMDELPLSMQHWTCPACGAAHGQPATARRASARCALSKQPASLRK